ncbi:MAG: DUF692 domain-containing protein [Deltaproteobacteria bacterium]|nr:DUF692 domain-containing protein [Deltaproteobacteria bacterium]
MTRTPPRVGLNFLPEGDFRAAALPLFEAGLVDALERDIDYAWGSHPRGERRDEPAWALEILDAYAADDALYGHGVWMSVMSGRWTSRQERWIAQLTDECRARRYRHVSEHFGWLSAGPFWRNTMLPAPYTPATVALGVDRLRRLADAVGCPVGLENLGMGLGPVDAQEQGAFLGEILDAVDGFLLLDVHNVWTQAHNARLDPLALLRTYPLARVRELHVSGGDWYEPAPGARPIRLDSHDGDVPGDVWPLVAEALACCPALEVVFLERRGQTLGREPDRAAYRADFLALRAAVEAAFDVGEERCA